MASTPEWIRATMASVGRTLTEALVDPETGSMSVRSSWNGRWARWIAEGAAVCLDELLGEACERLEVAGSVRRGRDFVKDLELVAIPKWRDVARDLFGRVVKRENLLETRVQELVRAGRLRFRMKEDGSRQGDGERAKFLVDGASGVPVDLFIATPATWGVTYFLRTGPGDWNVRFVEVVKSKRGILFRDARLVHPDGRILDSPEEHDVFRVCGVKWKDPIDRS